MKSDNENGINIDDEGRTNNTNNNIGLLQKTNTEKFEVYLVIFISVIIALLFFIYGRGGPNSSDITHYLNVGMNGITDPFILNRYFHVFIQAFFVKLVDNPLEGYHLFWGFLMGVNTFIVYMAARKMFANNTFLHGILAVFIFYAIPAIGEIEGVVTVDVTAMTIVAVIFYFYLLSVRNKNKNPWIIGALGFFIFLALKTKESTLPVFLLLLGLGWDNDDQFSFKYLIKNFLWVVCGMATGIMFIIVLNTIMLNNPFFGFRISDWQLFFATYISDSPYIIDAIQVSQADDWFRGYFFVNLFVPFVLFLISGVTTYNKSTFSQKLMWVLPIALIGFVILSINNRFGYMSRFIYPTLPIISICASQFFDLDCKKFRKHKWKIYSILVIGVILIILIRYMMRISIPDDRLSAVINLFYIPILFSLLISTIFLLRRVEVWNTINLVFLFGLLLSPVVLSYQHFFVDQYQYRRFNYLVQPFKYFDDQITFFPDMRFYVLDSSFRRAIDIAKNVDEFSALFNVYFNANSGRENVIFQYEPRDVVSDILTEDYDYVLITKQVWLEMNRNEAGVGLILDRYQFFTDPDERFVLLKPNHIY